MMETAIAPPATRPEPMTSRYLTTVSEDDKLFQAGFTSVEPSAIDDWMVHVDRDKRLFVINRPLRAVMGNPNAIKLAQNRLTGDFAFTPCAASDKNSHRITDKGELNPHTLINRSDIKTGVYRVTKVNSPSPHYIARKMGVDNGK